MIGFKDNSDEVKKKMEAALYRGLYAVGMTAEGNAKDILTKEVYTGDKDWPLTGLLRNSITFALSGEGANQKAYKADKPDSSGNINSGSYSGTAEGEKGESVYIGTNVVYAAGIELGTHRKAGAVHFLKKSATDYKEEYKKLMEESIKNA